MFYLIVICSKLTVVKPIEMYTTGNCFYFHSVTKDSISHIHISIIKFSVEKNKMQFQEVLVNNIFYENDDS
jgi:hypothetical protein